MSKEKISKLLKFIIIISYILHPFVLNYIKLERLIARPPVHQSRYNLNLTYIGSPRFSCSYLLEANYVKFKSDNEEKIATHYGFIPEIHKECKMKRVTTLSKIKFVIMTTLGEQCGYVLIII